MGAWSKMRGFFDRGEQLRAPMDDPFIQLDRDVLSSELRLRERGKEQGALELPDTSMQAPDVVEAEVEARIRDHFKRAQIDAANSIRTYDSRLSGLALIANLSSIRTQASIAVGEFKTEVVNRRGKLTPSRDAIRDSYEELRDFRKDNRLRRPAHDVPPTSATVGSMMVFWLLETIANSMFLRLGDSMGWLGGVIAAAVVGAINVGFAAFVGRQVWPKINHREAGVRMLGWIGSAAWLVLTVGWNLMAGHYRDAKSLGVANPEAAALGMLGSGLESIYSYGLLLAGLIFAFGAAIAAYKMDDPYPGYGPVWRRHAKRCEDYVADVKAATDELLDIRDDAIGEATDIRMELSRQLTQRQQIMSARDAFRRRYEEYAEQLESTANALLQEYRAANRAARSTVAPSRFNQPWKLSHEPLPIAPGEDIPRSAIDAAEQDLEATVSQISSAFDDAIDSFEPLDELKRRIADG
ncbi:hypothetical protein GCM10019071_34810 [Sphingobium fuliginis]|uniref:Transmembrane protein n=2 Tax=Sphingomonadaceae TaxID=41297 RepID=A0ABQ1F6S1_SPHSA|nr:hypothetical protein GCM10019071_34810 [Sphingobium fuliginis]